MSFDDALASAKKDNEAALQHHRDGARFAQVMMLFFFFALLLLFAFRIKQMYAENARAGSSTDLLEAAQQLNTINEEINRLGEARAIIELELGHRANTAEVSSLWNSFRDETGFDGTYFSVDSVSALQNIRAKFPYFDSAQTESYELGSHLNYVFEDIRVSISCIPVSLIPSGSLPLPPLRSVAGYAATDGASLLAEFCGSQIAERYDAAQNVAELNTPACDIATLRNMNVLGLALNRYLDVPLPEGLFVSDYWTDEEMRLLANWQDCRLAVAMLKSDAARIQLQTSEEAAASLKSIFTRIDTEQKERIEALNGSLGAIAAEIDAKRTEVTTASDAALRAANEVTSWEVFNEAWVYLLFSLVSLLGVQAGYQISRAHNFELITINRKISRLSELNTLKAMGLVDDPEVLLSLTGHEANPFAAKNNDLRSPLTRLIREQLNGIQGIQKSLVASGARGSS